MKISLSSYTVDLIAYALYITLLVAVPFIALKYFVLLGVGASCATLVMPIPLLITCYFTEKYGTVYGYRLVWKSVLVFLLMATFMKLVNLIPMDSHSVVSTAIWHQVLGQIPKVTICWALLYSNVQFFTSWLYNQRFFFSASLNALMSVFWGSLLGGSITVSLLAYLRIIHLPVQIWIGSMVWLGFFMLFIACALFLLKSFIQQGFLKNKLYVLPAPLLYGVYSWLLTIFWLLLLLTNVVVVKCLSIKGFFFTTGLLTYPFTFVATDIISELYGKQKALYAVWSGFLVSVVMMIVLFIVRWLPAHQVSPISQKAFSQVFSFTPGIVIASMLAYLSSQFVDIYLFEALRLRTGGRYLWLRNNVATMASELIDTVVFSCFVWLIWSYLSFITVSITMPAHYWYQLAMYEYMGKVIVALLDTPMVYISIRLLKRYV